VTVYTNMLDVWPDRPMNSSSSLHYDPYYETHVTIGNPYVPQGTELYVGW
jgi:beta-fructofuranosidase